MSSFDPIKLSEIIDLRVEQVKKQFIEHGYDPSEVNSFEDRHYLLGGLEDVARELHIPVIEYDGANPDGIPPSQDLLTQLEGRQFKIGMTLKINQQEWILIGGDSFDPVHGEIREGDIVPKGCSFEQLCFAPKKFIDVDV